MAAINHLQGRDNIVAGRVNCAVPRRLRHAQARAADLAWALTLQLDTT
jgi:hypothetical protein